MGYKKYFKQFWAFTQKEIFHILRDRKTLLILLALPLSQLLIFGFALSTDLVDTPTAIWDMSNDETTRRLSKEIENTETFEVIKHVRSKEEIEELFRQGKLKVAFIFQSGFAEKLYRENHVNLQMIVDASLGTDATTIEGYMQSILMRYNMLVGGMQIPIEIVPEIHMRYNPQLKSSFQYVPGVIGVVLMLICSMMASLAIVKEKESGTMEVLLVSPVRPSIIILSKLVPYLLLAMFDVVVILIVSIFVLEVPVTGNIFLLFWMASILALDSLALGIMVSVLTTSQRSAIIISIIGLMVPAIAMSGFIFPLRDVSLGMNIFSHAIPVTSFISAARKIMIKGLGIEAVLPELLLLLGMTVVLIVISIKCFKNRLS